MQVRLQEIRERAKRIKRINWTSNKYKPANALYMTQAKKDIPYLPDALDQAQEENNRLESRSEIMKKEYSRIHKQMREYGQEADELEIKLQQSQDRERVLQDALKTTCGAVEDLMAIGSEYGTCGYQVIVDEAREALEQEVKLNGNN